MVTLHLGQSILEWTKRENCGGQPLTNLKQYGLSKLPISLQFF